MSSNNSPRDRSGQKSPGHPSSRKAAQPNSLPQVHRLSDVPHNPPPYHHDSAVHVGSQIKADEDAGKDKIKTYSLEALAGLSATLPTDRRSHLAVTGKQLLHAWRNNKFCDIVLKADHSLFHAHLEVFVAFTDYFAEIPAERKLLQINLGDVKPDDAATVLKYLYFGELQANAENIYGVWMIAKALKVHDIVAACAGFIDRLLAPRNLIYVLEFCEAKNIQDLYVAAYDRFILTFEEQTRDEAFLEWNVEKVARLLGCDDLKIKTELDLYVVMKRWIDHRRPERMTQLEHLVELIRFAHMTRDEIVQCTLMDPSFLEVRKVKELLATANWYITMQQSGRHWSEFQLPKPRHPPRKGLPESRAASQLVSAKPQSPAVVQLGEPLSPPAPRPRKDKLHTKTIS
ncbi:putative Kelch-like protein 5 [Hypsibius exemplaris]|uniref:Kelch-like protein 5 n=1 Tax=Hypsibius exemplaris TaxID=2072580 RepID=A0A1W0WUF7_HYPEX|nr:putative Kelch-like protein 5 [Hypsibius exemplaris]